MSRRSPQIPDGPRNIAASVRARLLNLAKQRSQPFDLLLTRYVLERLLYPFPFARALSREKSLPRT